MVQKKSKNISKSKILLIALVKNLLTRNGKKHLSEKLFLKSLKVMQKNYRKNHKHLIKTSLVNVSSILNIKQIKAKRKNTQEFPYVTKKARRIAFSVKAILTELKSQPPQMFYLRFKTELIFAAKNLSSINKINKAKHEHAFFIRKLSNYRWFN